MSMVEEQIMERAAEDFEKEFPEKVKLFAKRQQKEKDGTVRIRRCVNICGTCMRQEG